MHLRARHENAEIYRCETNLRESLERSDRALKRTRRAIRVNANVVNATGADRRATDHCSMNQVNRGLTFGLARTILKPYPEHIAREWAGDDRITLRDVGRAVYLASDIDCHILVGRQGRDTTP
jgi:hypothetical protein